LAEKRVIGILPGNGTFRSVFALEMKGEMHEGEFFTSGSPVSKRLLAGNRLFAFWFSDLTRILKTE